MPRNNGSRLEMKLFALAIPAALAALFAGSAASAQQSSACVPEGRQSGTRLYVDVEGIRSSDGLVAVTLYADDSKKFLASRGSVYVGRVPARKGTTRVCLYLPGPGVYALAVYHDEDGDRGLDRTAFLPKEGVGFSNNPDLFLGLPSFRAVRLSVPKTNLRTRVTIHYP